MGVAIVNPSSTQTTVVSVSYKDENGNEVARDSLPLLPRGQVPFDIARQTPGLGGRGVAEFTSPDVALTGLGLRFSPVGMLTLIQGLRRGTTNSAAAHLANRGWRRMENDDHPGEYRLWTCQLSTPFLGTATAPHCHFRWERTVRGRRSPAHSL